MFEIIFTDYTLRTVLLGTAAIGAVSGALGCFAYLRRQSLIGDVVSHSSLMGIVLFFVVSYLVTGVGSKSLWVLIPGAIAAGVASLLLTRAITTYTSIKRDAGLGVMLAIFFGSGVLLLHWVQRAKPAIPGRAGLSDYLFGMAAAMGSEDLTMIGVLGVLAIGVTLLLWKEFKVFTFDADFSHTLGFNSSLLDCLLLTILVVGIVIGIQAVGVVLMIALLVTPASAARQWTSRLGPMVALAACFGAFCGVVGSFISATFAHLPTGPVICLTATLLFLISITLAPRRGLFWKMLRQRRFRKPSGQEAP